ncbi:MAG: hypothetical protein DI539_16295 [Flavobacterium psychrophilum]|nr:MAG: hypothetical protein DI539_16295 [Flavobacterium psychrophilum]
MKKSTFRIMKSIGMFLFLILFGVFIYAITRTDKIECNELAVSPESDPQDLDVLLDTQVAIRPIGFEYQRITEQSAEA